MVKITKDRAHAIMVQQIHALHLVQHNIENLLPKTLEREQVLGALRCSRAALKLLWESVE